MPSHSGSTIVDKFSAASTDRIIQYSIFHLVLSNYFHVLGVASNRLPADGHILFINQQKIKDLLRQISYKSTVSTVNRLKMVTGVIQLAYNQKLIKRIR